MTFTPQTKDGYRVRLEIDEQDIPRGYRWHKILKVGNKTLKAHGVGCGLPNCLCDAKVDMTFNELNKDFKLLPVIN